MASPVEQRTLPRALLVTAAAAVLPGLGHLLLGRRRTGGAILAVVALAATGLGIAVARTDGTELAAGLFSTPVLVAVTAGCALVALGWTATIVRTYDLARPRRLGTGRRLCGGGVVVALCAAVVTPLGVTANAADSQRALLDEVFPNRPTPADPAPSDLIGRPRLNLLLLGSDAGPDRTGARTDTMMVASLDTRTAEVILFALPRNIQRAPFPQGSTAAQRFPDGFPDLLNAVYGYGHANPGVAPAGPTADPGTNLLMSSVEELLGLPLHHYVSVDMVGLAAVVDALGGVTVDVGPQRLPIGGVTPSGRLVEPEGYLEPGVQHLDGHETLWYTRSRRNSDDYDRMARQRCLIDAVLSQNSPTELLLRFRAVAAAAGGGVRTDIPRSMLPALVTLTAEQGPPRVRSVAFDPDLPAPGEPGGTFRPARPDVEYMREVVADALAAPGEAPVADAGEPPGTEGPRTSALAAGGGLPAPRPSSIEPAPACAGVGGGPDDTDS
ncbi:MAG TPA: LCP family protein [Pseudonocardia sp.]|nr:LCP family protein [Pseudonocardia sp.]